MPLAEKVLARKRLNHDRFCAVQYLCHGRSFLSFRPLAVIPVIVVLQHLPAFQAKDVLQSDLQREGERTRDVLKGIENNLESLTSTLTGESAYLAGNEADGYLLETERLLERRTTELERAEFLQRAMGGPETAVGEMVRAVIDHAGGEEAVVSFLLSPSWVPGIRTQPWLELDPEKTALKQLRIRIEQLEQDIRQTDIQHYYAARSPFNTQVLMKLGKPAEAGVDELAGCRRALDTVLRQAATRIENRRALDEARQEADRLDRMNVARRREHFEGLVQDALAGKEAARSEIERESSDCNSGKAWAQFHRSVKRAKWSAMTVRISRYLPG